MPSADFFDFTDVQEPPDGVVLFNFNIGNSWNIFSTFDFGSLDFKISLNTNRDVSFSFF